MAVVASVAINVDSRDAAAKLRQFQQQSTAAGRAAEQLQQGTTAAGQAAQSAGRQFQTAANGLKYYIDATGRARKENGQFVSTAEAAAAGLQRQGQAARGATTAVNGLTAAIGGLLPALAVADLGRRFFAGFNEAEKAAAAVRTLGVDSNELNQRLLGVSISLGGLYSQTQLLTAAYDVASSGFANAADNAKILEAAANGATGGLSDINTVGNAVTSVLNAYGKSADEAANLVDGFIQTQNDGKIVLNEYAQQIGRLAPTAAAAGVGITELNAAVATITAQGVPVEATFTGLNQALVSILKPSQEATELAKELGIDFNEAGLRAKGFGGLLEEVKQKTGGSTTALVKLFGSVDALKAILPLVNDDLVKYNQNLGRQAQVSGVAENAARELGSTVSGEITKLINGIGNLARTVDSVLGPAIKAVLNEALFAINTINQLLNTGARARSFGLDRQGRKNILNQAQQEAEDIVTRRRIADPFERNRQFQEIAAQRERDLIEAYGMRTGQIKLQAVAPVRPPAVGADPRIQSVLAGMEGGRSGGRGRAGGKSEAEKAAEAAKRQAEELKRSYELGTQLGTQYQRQLLLLDASTEQERRRLQIQFDFEDREKQISELKSKTQQANLRDLSNEQKRLELRQLDLDYLREQLSIFERIAGLDFSKTADLGKRAFAGGAGTFDPSLPDLRVSPAEQQMTKYREELAALTNPINMAVTGADAIGNAFGQAFQDIATGAKSTQEALADVFKGIGEAFIQMAAQIIAKQLAMIAFQTILKALGGGGGGFGFSGAGPAALPSGDDFAAGFSMPALMADGGFVTKPTTAVVGEGGEPEYVIPASKMRTAMARYSGGARGDAVIPGSGAEPAASGGGAAVATPIDVRYTVERINSVDYVTADQFQRGMAQAAQQGAIQGERRAMRSLKNSAATRKGVGI